MLTGDRLETAVAVSYDCRIITEDFKKIYMLFDKPAQNLVDEISTTLDILKGNKFKIALVIEGNAIRNFLFLILKS
jgi:magnesium-transporting ATPase (P-type)